jgi:hypothetical protein
MGELAQSISSDSANGLGELKDPFSAKCVKAIHITIDKAYFAPYNVQFKARIEFANGGTEATQRLAAEDLPALINKVGSFLNSLKST